MTMNPHLADVQAAPVRPLVASVDPVPMPLPPTVAAAPSDAETATAGALLKRAFDFFKDDHNAEAAATFRAALATGNLNDAGRALAYWHIYLSEQSQGRANQGIDALASFVVVAQDVLSIREQLRYAEDDSGDFVDRFDLKRRLSRARAILSAAWAGQTGAFGRSAEQPVLVHNSAERDFFLQMMPPCGHPHGRRVATRQEDRVQQVDLSCVGETNQASYYFQTVEDSE